MVNASSELVAFVLAELPGKPLAVRVRLYRAVAELETNEAMAAELRNLADELEACEARSEALQLELLLSHHRTPAERKAGQ